MRASLSTLHIHTNMFRGENALPAPFRDVGWDSQALGTQTGQSGSCYFEPWGGRWVELAHMHAAHTDSLFWYGRIDPCQKL